MLFMADCKHKNIKEFYYNGNLSYRCLDCNLSTEKQLDLKLLKLLMNNYKKK